MLQSTSYLRRYNTFAQVLVQYERFPEVEKPPCAWPSAPVRMLALLRNPAERAQSAYMFGLAECVCNFKFSWCTAYSSFRYKNRVHHLCDNHRPRHAFSHAVNVLHGHHGLTFSPTSTDSEHVLGRYTRAVAREIYTPYFGSYKSQDGKSSRGTSAELARVTLAHCFAWVGIAEEWEVSLRLLKLELPAFFGHLDVDQAGLQWTVEMPHSMVAGASTANDNATTHPYLHLHLLANDFAVYEAERARLHRRAHRAGIQRGRN